MMNFLDRSKYDEFSYFQLNVFLDSPNIIVYAMKFVSVIFANLQYISSRRK